MAYLAFVSRARNSRGPQSGRTKGVTSSDLEIRFTNHIVVLTLTRMIKSVVTGQATLKLRKNPEKKTPTNGSTCIL